MSSPLVDFHCHLDLYPDFEKAIKESEAAKIYTLAVTTTPRAWKRNQELMKGLKYVRPALGLHPQLVGKDTSAEVRLWEELLPQTKYVGEVGLDAGPAYRQTLEKQKQVLERILRLCAKEGDKVLSVHAVRSTSIVLDMVESLLPPSRCIVVLHWFTGTPAQARRAVQLGCYFSVNVAMLRSNRGRFILNLIPLDRMLTETDGPFIENSKLNPRKDIELTLELISDIKAMPESAITNQIALNLRDLLRSK